MTKTKTKTGMRERIGRWRSALGGAAAAARRRLDFNYFIRVLIDVPRTAAISAGPLAATFYMRGVSYVSERGRKGEGREVGRERGSVKDFVRSHVSLVRLVERARTKEARGCGCGGHQNRTPISHELNWLGRPHRQTDR